MVRLTDGIRWTAIPEGTTVQDIVPGRPEDLKTLADDLAGYASSFADAAAELRTLDTSSWEGEAAEAFRKVVTGLPKKLDTACDSFTAAKKAVTAYRTALIDAQAIAKDVVDHDAPEARRRSRNHQRAVDDYNAAVELGDAGGLTRPPSTDPGQEAMAAAAQRVNDAIAVLEEAAESAERTIDKAAEDAPDKPGRLASFLKGLGEGTVGLLDFTLKVNPGYALVDPEGALDFSTTQLDTLVRGAQHPVEFGKSAIDWETWKTEPWRAVGHLGPAALLFLATRGAGAAARGAGGGARVPPARRARENLADLATAFRDLGRRVFRTDPVDMATGEMVLSQTDVRLPGALPLVLERTHLSSYRAGGWFGPSWASTLDQRLELDAEGAVLTRPDGVLLAYPPPVPGAAVLPEQGPRHPLTWDGTPGGEICVTDPGTGRTYRFSPSPGDPSVLPLTCVEDRNGHEISVLRDRDGVPTGIHHSGGYRIAVDTEQARVVGLRLLATGPPHPADSGTALAAYRYDADGNLTEVVNSSGRPLRFTYDAEGRMTSWEDRNGSRYRYAYDRRTGRCTATTGPDGFLSSTLRYSAQDRTTVCTDSLGRTTTYHLNHRHQVVRETDPLGGCTTSEWDAEDRLLARTDPLGRTTRRTYDADGNLVRVTRPDGSAATAAYNDQRLPVTVTHPDGARWQHAYDARGNLTATTDPAGAVTTCTYDEAGHLASVRDALAHTHRIETNPAGLPTAVTDPLGATTAYTRDAFGRVAAVTDPVGGVTRLGWTAEGQPAWRTLPDGATERWAWDGEGNLLEHTDAIGGTTRHEYTHFDLLAARTTPDGARTAFAYDTELRLTAVTNPQGLTWTYTYDAAGRPASETDFDGRVLTYTHDAAGRLASRTNGLGETTRYTRDQLGNVTGQHSPDGTTTFAHDPAGRLIRAAGADAEVVLTRDPLGRILTETCNGRTLTSTYDVLGRRTRRETPSGAVSTWEWNPNSQPTALTTAGRTLDITYDEAGRETGRGLGGTARLTQQWNGAHRLTAQTLTRAPAPGAAPTSLRALAAGGEPELLQHRTFAYREDGYLSSVADSGATGPDTRRFALDAAGRVTSVTGADWTETYTYDAAGNLTHAATPLTEDTDGPRTLTGTLLHRAGAVRYAYDGQGRVTLRQTPRPSRKPATWRYTWDTQDRLTTVTTPDGTRWHYRYDPLGRRIAKQRLTAEGTVAEEIAFTWDGHVLVEQTVLSRSTSRFRTTTWNHSGLHPTVQYERVGDAVTGEEIDRRFYAIITDLIGAPTELVDVSGAVGWRSRGTLWGSAAGSSGDAADTPLRFPGQYRDTETGLHYNHHRYYDPRTARYLTRDPLNLAAGPNPVAYVSNPHSWADVTGLAPCRPPVGAVVGDADRIGGWHPSSIPDESVRAIQSLERNGVEANGAGPDYAGPQLPEKFANDGRNGGYVLPTTDEFGNSIRYSEWGTVQARDNPRPGGERIVVGSDGSVYYSPTHYQTWIRYK